MNALLWVNLIAFLFVTAYAVSLFVYVVKTRIEYIKLGRKAEFEQDVKKRLENIWINVFGQKKLLKDKKSGIIHVMFFYGFILVQFGAIDFIWKGIKPGSHLPLGPLYSGFTFFQEIVALLILVAVVWAFHRRYVEKLVRLKRNFKSGLVLLFIGGLMLSVLVGNGMGIVWHGDAPSWSEPIASMISLAFSWVGKTGA
ncbi:MAG: hypothetical protein Q8898_11135, partial [Bacillota bacterium]|nr:hypothetical protein [Bacillota bacterium]